MFGLLKNVKKSVKKGVNKVRKSVKGVRYGRGGSSCGSHPKKPTGGAHCGKNHPKKNNGGMRHYKKKGKSHKKGKSLKKKGKSLKKKGKKSLKNKSGGKGHNNKKGLHM